MCTTPAGPAVARSDGGQRFTVRAAAAGLDRFRSSAAPPTASCLADRVAAGHLQQRRLATRYAAGHWNLFRGVVEAPQISGELVRFSMVPHDRADSTDGATRFPVLL